MTRINVTRINYSGNNYIDFDVVHAVNALYWPSLHILDRFYDYMTCPIYAGLKL